MTSFSFRKVLVILVSALVIWALCGFVMFAGIAFTTLNAALIIHTLAAPAIAAIVTRVFSKRFHYTPPLVTAVVFTGVVIFMDVFVVALLIQGSFAMFSSLLGTWIPFVLIFIATYLAGRQVEAEKAAKTAIWKA